MYNTFFNVAALAVMLMGTIAIAAFGMALM